MGGLEAGSGGGAQSVGMLIKQGIYQESATPKYRVGDVLRLSDGRAFRYAKNGAVALAIGKYVTAVGAVETNKQVYAAAIGSYTVGLKTSSAQASSTQEGYFYVNDGTGQGQYYKVKSTETHPSSASHTLVTLYDPLVTAVVASGTSEASLGYNPWMNVVLQASSTTMVVGVPLIAVTANYYFWCQTWGVCCTLSGDGAAVGARLTTNATNFGENVAEGTASIIQTYGIAIDAANVDTEYNLNYLTIAP